MSEREQPKQTLDAIEHKKNLEELRRKLTDAIDFLTTWEEQEEKKRSATETEIQS